MGMKYKLGKAGEISPALQADIPVFGDTLCNMWGLSPPTRG